MGGLDQGGGWDWPLALRQDPNYKQAYFPLPAQGSKPKPLIVQQSLFIPITLGWSEVVKIVLFMKDDFFLPKISSICLVSACLDGKKLSR